MHLGLASPLAEFVVEAVSHVGPGYYTLLSAVQSLALAGGVLFWLRYIRPGPVAALGSRDRPWRNVLWGVLFGVGMLVLATILAGLLEQIVSAILGHRITPPRRIPRSVRGVWLWLLGPTLVVFAPIGEEMFFRGFLYRALRARLRVSPAVAISAAVFGLAHVYPLTIAVIFVDGVILALLYERYHNLLLCIAAHATNNLIVFLVLLVSKG